MTKSCANCRALNFDPPQFSCRLNLPIATCGAKFYDRHLGKFPNIRPVFKCRKPLTIKDFLYYEDLQKWERTLP